MNAKRTVAVRSVRDECPDVSTQQDRRDGVREKLIWVAKVGVYRCRTQEIGLSVVAVDSVLISVLALIVHRRCTGPVRLLGRTGFLGCGHAFRKRSDRVKEQAQLCLCAVGSLSLAVQV